MLFTGKKSRLTTRQGPPNTCSGGVHQWPKCAPKTQRGHYDCDRPSCAELRSCPIDPASVFFFVADSATHVRTPSDWDFLVDSEERSKPLEPKRRQDAEHDTSNCKYAATQAVMLRFLLVYSFLLRIQNFALAQKITCWIHWTTQCKRTELESAEPLRWYCPCEIAWTSQGLSSQISADKLDALEVSRQSTQNQSETQTFKSFNTLGVMVPT